MNKKINFLNEEGKEIFQINDGASIQITDGYAYDFAIRCHYVDEETFLLGKERTNFLEFAKQCKAKGRIFKPELVPDSYVGGWKIFMKDKIGYLTVQELADEPGWDCVFYDMDFNDLDQDVLPEESAEDLIDARNQILEEFPEWDDCYMKAYDWEEIFEENDVRLEIRVKELEKYLK